MSSSNTIKNWSKKDSPRRKCFEYKNERCPVIIGRQDRRGDSGGEKTYKLRVWEKLGYETVGSTKGSLSGSEGLESVSGASNNR